MAPWRLVRELQRQNQLPYSASRLRVTEGIEAKSQVNVKLWQSFKYTQTIISRDKSWSCGNKSVFFLFLSQSSQFTKTKMSLHWTLIAGFLYCEIATLFLLLLPFISTRVRILSWSQSRARWLAHILFTDMEQDFQIQIPQGLGESADLLLLRFGGHPGPLLLGYGLQTGIHSHWSIYLYEFQWQMPFEKWESTAMNKRLWRAPPMVATWMPKCRCIWDSSELNVTFTSLVSLSFSALSSNAWWVIPLAHKTAVIPNIVIIDLHTSFPLQVALISTNATLDAERSAAMKQAKSASLAAETLMDGGSKSGSGGDRSKELEKELRETKEGIAQY